MRKIEYLSNASVSDKELNELFHSVWPNHVKRKFGPVLARSLTYVCAFDDQRLVFLCSLAPPTLAFFLDRVVSRHTVPSP